MRSEQRIAAMSPMHAREFADPEKVTDNIIVGQLARDTNKRLFVCEPRHATRSVLTPLRVIGSRLKWQRTSTPVNYVM
jgi:hypothetical protein